MIALLLCAGYATRLYPLTENYPKPLLPVAGRPVIDYLMDQLLDIPEVKEIHVVTNSKFHPVFESWQSGWSQQAYASDITIQLHNDGTSDNTHRLGAVADLQFGMQKIGSPVKVLVSAGDNIFLFQIKKLLRRFLKKDHHCVVALPENDASQLRQTGVVVMDAHDRVLQLQEKPRHAASGWTAPALYFFQPSVFSKMDEFLSRSGTRPELGHFIDFICRQEAVYALKVESGRLDIGSLESYREADRYLKKAGSLPLL